MTLKTRVWLLKIQLRITGINYVLKLNYYFNFKLKLKAVISNINVILLYYIIEFLINAFMMRISIFSKTFFKSFSKL